MSTKYKSPRDVPTDVLTSRLRELAGILSRERGRIDAEFTMRVPAECDRDADLVLSEAARRLRELQPAPASSAEASLCEEHEPVSTPHCPICLLKERDAAMALLRECQTILREECGARVDYIELNAFLKGTASAKDILAALGDTAGDSHE